MNLDLGPALARAQTVVNGLIAAIPSNLVALVVFGAFLVLGVIVKAVVARLTPARLQAHRNARMAVGRLAQGLVIFVGLLVALSAALPTFRPGDVVQVLGISSVAIGFVFRDILQNFLAGILLLVTQPFRIGDQIVGVHEGTVEDIQTRATFIRTYDGRRVVIPNAVLFTDTVVVNTAFEHRRLEYDIGIGYGDDVDRARDVILETVRGTEGVLADPAPDVLLMDLASSSTNLRVRWWIAPAQRADALDARIRQKTATATAADSARGGQPVMRMCPRPGRVADGIAQLSRFKPRGRGDE